MQQWTLIYWMMAIPHTGLRTNSSRIWVFIDSCEGVRCIYIFLISGTHKLPHSCSLARVWVWFPVSSSLAYYSWHIIFLAITSSHQVFGQSSKVSSALLYISGQLLLWFYFLLFICLLLHIASSFSCVVVIYISVTFIFVYYFIFLLASHHQMFCFQHGGVCDGIVC